MFIDLDENINLTLQWPLETITMIINKIFEKKFFKNIDIPNWTQSKFRFKKFHIFAEIFMLALNWSQKTARMVKNRFQPFKIISGT